MSSNCYMGLDFGTQGVRCGIFNEYGDIISISEGKYGTIYPSTGWAEQSPDEWLCAMEAAMGGCYSQAGQEVFNAIKALSICCTASTVIPVDRENLPITNAILWMDNRAKKQALKINETRHQILKHCGMEESVEWLIPKMLWIKENQPEVYAKAVRIVEQQDYINHHLTGRWCASISQATCKGNYVASMGGFSEDFFTKIGLADYKEKIDQDVIKQGEVVGKLRGDLAEKLRLSPDLIVYQGGIDAHISMIGLGVCKPGDMGAVMGTSFVHLAVVDQPIFKIGVWGPYRDAIIPDLYCIEGGQVSAGSITKWFLEEFGIMEEDPYQFMAKEAKKVPIGSKGVITLDFFQGNRTPYKDPNAKGVFYGLSLNNNRADIYRSIMEGIAFGSRNIIDTFSSNNVQLNRIMVCGGVTKNPLWLQIIADVTGKPITLTRNSANSGILGCAILNAVGSGLYTSFEEAANAMVQCTNTIYPDPKAHDEYNQFYIKYLKLYDNLKEIMSN